MKDASKETEVNIIIMNYTLPLCGPSHLCICLFCPCGALSALHTLISQASQQGRTGFYPHFTEETLRHSCPSHQGHVGNRPQASYHPTSYSNCCSLSTTSLSRSLASIFQGLAIGGEQVTGHCCYECISLCLLCGKSQVALWLMLCCLSLQGRQGPELWQGPGPL